MTLTSLLFLLLLLKTPLQVDMHFAGLNRDLDSEMGQTRSFKKLIATLKDKKSKETLPIKSLDTCDEQRQQHGELAEQLISVPYRNLIQARQFDLEPNKIMPPESGSQTV